MQTTMIFDFNKTTKLNNWKVVDDVVMGGISSGTIDLNEDGHGVFSGKVSLENNGGFSSLRYTFESIKVQPEKHILKIRLKGDGKEYQFRIKDNVNTYYSYASRVKTSGEWEEISIPLHEMNAVFRGRNVDVPNFDRNQIEEFTILIGNKKAENFEVLIDYITIEN